MAYRQDTESVYTQNILIYKNVHAHATLIACNKSQSTRNLVHMKEHLVTPIGAIKWINIHINELIFIHITCKKASMADTERNSDSKGKNNISLN